MADVTGVLVMAYGTPETLDDVEAYYTDIRHGRPPSEDELESLIARYRAIGGRSPLFDITLTQASGIEQRVEGVKTYVGQKHAPPFIADAVSAMASDGVERAVGLVLAPHYSSMSVGDYARRAHRAAEAVGWRGKLEMIESWHLEPSFIDILGSRVTAAWLRLSYGARAAGIVVFTAHSLPEQILRAGDPYPEQVRETAEAIASRARIQRWRVAWQSGGREDVQWLRPDVMESLDEITAFGGRGVVVCPCGFVSDHLEVLYDIDIEAKERARELGVELVRTTSLNTDPAFLDTLARIVRRALHDV